MRISITKLMVLSIFCTFLFFQNGRAYDNYFTHPYINEKVVKEHSSFDTILKTSIGLNGGIYASYLDKQIWQLVRDGGKEEDEPSWRCLRHFHDPLNSNWDNAGLMSVYQSMIYWAQTPAPANSYGLYNEYSWILAREYYHQALLTGSEELYAKTFRAIGQLMHLVSDAAVPAHVRNDPHAPFLRDADKYEEYVKSLFYKENEGIASLEFDNFTVDRAIFDKAVSDPMAPSPISALWDHNEYEAGGSTLPDGSITTIGLAEYTNANFWTEDTFPWKALSGNYPHPALEDTNYDENVWLNPESIDAEDGEIDNRIYFSKETGDPVKHFLAAGYWYYQLFMWNKPETDYAFLLDEVCFNDYAAKLIPRAVGYSAALLDYFFRGELEVTVNPHFRDNVMEDIGLNIQNVTETQEAMSEGNFFLLFRFTPVNGNTDGSDDVFVLADQTPTSGTLSYEDIVERAFTTSQDIPVECWNSVTCTLVFRGKLGNETNAVVGKVFKPGKIILNEDWKNGIVYTDDNWQDMVDNGDNTIKQIKWQDTGNIDDYASKEAIDGHLIMTSSRPPDQNGTSRVNSMITDFTTDGSDGILITATAELHFLIPEMNTLVEDPEDLTNNGIQLYFNDGTVFHYSGDGRPIAVMESGIVPLGFSLDDKHYIDNIVNRFLSENIPVPDPLYLRGIHFKQKAYIEDLNDYSFYMDVDAIRLFDTKWEEQ